MKVEIKTPEQITKMKEACAIARDVLQKARSVIQVSLCYLSNVFLPCVAIFIENLIRRYGYWQITMLFQPGVTTDFINETVHQEIVSRGAYPSPLKYRGFPKSCCTSVNNVVVHGIPDDRQLLDGDIINIDVTVFYDDFHGDTSDTFAVGNVDAAAKKLVRATRECLQRGIDVCGPGQTFNAIGKAIEPYANSLQFSVCRQYVGHGIGSYFHGPPNIHHYRRLKVRPGTMEPGMTFTIEPILMEGVPETRLLSDGWTVVSTDNQRSAQAEHTVLITDSGVEILTWLLNVICWNSVIESPP